MTSRRSLRVLATLLLLTTLASAGGGAAAGKIEPALLDQLRSRGSATFYVELDAEADLADAAAIRDWAARGAFVYRTLRAHADRTQAPLRAFLDARGVPYRSFFSYNALELTGSEPLAQALAARPEVRALRPARVYRLDPRPRGLAPTSPTAVEWNVAQINADDVWTQLGVTGQGIVVANIDTGVDFDHEALVNQYRGRTPTGFDHNYNWFDPAGVCNPPTVPCDNNDHGTHTMGTMVGGDGPGPFASDIGVAPGAKWIAAKGCESSSCSSSSLLLSGEWVLAPTDLNGQNPRPDLRPHVVNNSWGDQSGGDPWYRQTVRAWIAAGIFPAFAAGNNAFPPFLVCRTTGSPGDYRESFASGATDRNDAIAAFSSRGPSDFGAIKPDVVAPGVDVRSSVRNNGYAAFDGTSMASPHSAATVALLWSALPALTGDVPSTQYLLKTSALGRPDARCGDAGPPNNVYGWGRLDARAAIQAGQTVGRLTGLVTGRGVPLKTAIVVISDPLATFTASDGSYSAYPRPGTYQVTVRKSGYASQTKTATITTGQTTRLDFDLE